MDFSKLSQNEKMALYGSVAVFLAGIISNWGGLFWLAILAAIGMAAVVLAPQMSSGMSLPGSKGTLMATLGIVALGAGLIEVLRYISYFFNSIGSFSTIMFIVALLGAAVMAWAGWSELQKEGGKWVFGMAKPAAAPPAAATAEPMTTPEPMAPERPAEPMPPPSDTMGSSEPEDRGPGA